MSHMEGTLNNTYLIQYIVSVTANFQSRELFFPLCAPCWAVKQSLEALHLLFDELNGSAEDATSIHPDYLPLLVTHKDDMSAGWKLTKKGGVHPRSKRIFVCIVLVGRKRRMSLFHLVMIVRHCRKINLWGGMSDYTACYHCNLVDDLELKKIHDRSTEIMKMINTDMPELLN
jgi:hypothetical protein